MFAKTCIKPYETEVVSPIIYKLQPKQKCREAPTISIFSSKLSDACQQITSHSNLREDIIDKFSNYSTYLVKASCFRNALDSQRNTINPTLLPTSPLVIGSIGDWIKPTSKVFLSCIRSYSVATDRVASRVSKHVYAGREFYVKRDDENSLSGPALSSVSGNKSRKLLHLSEMKPFPDILASYGGSQSNSMLAIAKVAASSSAHNNFFYFMKPLPKFLKNCPTGNLKAALDLGMQVVEVSADVYESLEKIPKNRRDFPTSVLDSLSKGIVNSKLDASKIISISNSYWLPQGAAMPEAELGVEQLVDELLQFIILQDSVSTSPNRPWKVVLACGTGTMALFAARHFALKVAVKKKEEDIFHGITRPSKEMIRDSTVQSIDAEVRNLDLESNGIPDIEVVAVPCVGDSQYLKDQMQTLDLDSGCLKIYPTILKTETERKVILEALSINASSLTSTAAAAASDTVDIEKADNRIFGKPYKEHYQIWCDMKANMDIEFDLIYTPRTFELLLQSFIYDIELWKNSNILYYHCGGVEGNESQIGRYRFQKIL